MMMRDTFDRCEKCHYEIKKVIQFMFTLYRLGVLPRHKHYRSIRKLVMTMMMRNYNVGPSEMNDYYHMTNTHSHY